MASTAALRIAAGAALTVLLALSAAFFVHARARGQDTGVDEFFRTLRTHDPRVPSMVALVNGERLDSSSYEGELAVIKACAKGPAWCRSAGAVSDLGAESVALTHVVDLLLLEQYGRANGITVSDAEVQAALRDQVSGMKRGLAAGGPSAEAIRQNLAGSHFTDPSQILADPGWQDRMRHILLVGKTRQAYAPTDRGSDDLLLSLQQQATIDTKIAAHVLDPHQPRRDPTPSTGPPPTVPACFLPDGATVPPCATPAGVVPIGPVVVGPSFPRAP